MNAFKVKLKPTTDNSSPPPSIDFYSMIDGVRKEK
jgi:hypothetical protein